MTMNDEFGEVLLETQHKQNLAKLYRKDDTYHVLEVTKDSTDLTTTDTEGLHPLASEMAASREYSASRELGQLILDNIEDL